MNVGYLYVTRNLVDDVLYVGQSSKMDERSLASYLGSGDYFRQALAEHGESNFAKTILDYYDDSSELDYAEVHTIARLRAEGLDLYNGGVGGARTQQQFIRAMFERFGVLPNVRREWFSAVDTHHDEVRELILCAAADTDTDAFYRELEMQLRLTQDLTGPCPRCGANSGLVCRTKTGNPSKNHAGRRVSG